VHLVHNIAAPRQSIFIGLRVLAAAPSERERRPWTQLHNRTQDSVSQKQTRAPDQAQGWSFPTTVSGNLLPFKIPATIATPATRSQPCQVPLWNPAASLTGARTEGYYAPWR
jgi:hypothetical protein